MTKSCGHHNCDNDTTHPHISTIDVGDVLHPILRSIRTDLRLAMNGIVSTSMREKGVHYRINFGCSLHRVRDIADKHTPSRALAERLWSEDIREFKILATMMMPREETSEELARAWISEVRHQEVAEQLVFNLLQHLPFAQSLGLSLVGADCEYPSVIAWLIIARSAMKEDSFDDITSLLAAADSAFEAGTSRRQRAAQAAIGRLVRTKHGGHIMNHFAHFARCGDPLKEEIYTALSYEL